VDAEVLFQEEAHQVIALSMTLVLRVKPLRADMVVHGMVIPTTEEEEEGPVIMVVAVVEIEAMAVAAVHLILLLFIVLLVLPLPLYLTFKVMQGLILLIILHPVPRLILLLVWAGIIKMAAMG
jgi:hypothetical protein